MSLSTSRNTLQHTATHCNRLCYESFYLALTEYTNPLEDLNV